MSRGCSRQFCASTPSVTPLALGHDGLWIFADRILSDRSLANRRRRRRRLLARQISGGGSAQHGQGCSRSEYNLHHDYSPYVWTASPSRSPGWGQPKRDAPSSHHHLARAVSTAARFNDALTELATQRKSACITCSADPFRGSVARIARTRRWQARRIPVLDTGLTRLRFCGDQRTTFSRHFAACVQPRSIRILFKPSRIRESAAATRLQ